MRQRLVLLLICCCACVLGFALPAMAADAAGDKEPIKIMLPDPCYGGTPTDYWSDALEPENFKDWPPIMAPKDTALVSKGKPVTSSVKSPAIGELAMLVDGDKNYVPGSIMELPEGLQWVEVDLQSPHEIYAVLLWHYYKDKWVYFDVIVQVSNDPEFKTGVTTLYNNDVDNSSHLGAGKDKEYRETNKGRLIEGNGVIGRYIRSYTNGNCANDRNNYIEMEVFGRPAK